jgi:FkbM family methyltransferase
LETEESSNVNGMKIIVPKTFNKILPVSPNSDYFEFESEVFLGLKLLVTPGSVVFDIGSAYGIMATLISKLAGKDGKVFSFEPNSSIIEKAKELAGANHLNNVTCVNKFVGERSIPSTDFYLIPGYQTVASTKNPDILKFHPDAVPTRVPVIAIDDFVKESGVVPNICNIDVEGAEYIAIKGMYQLLASSNTNQGVDIIMETHGNQLLKIGGSLNDLLDYVLRIGYGILDLSTFAVAMNKKEELPLSSYQNQISHFFISRKLKSSSYVKEFISRALDEVISSQERISSIIRSIQDTMDNRKDYNSSGALLRLLLSRLSNHSQLNYLYAICLHVIGHDLESALNHYNIALEEGFDKFWVKYNRASLLSLMGRKEEAIVDIDEAVQLKPEHEDALKVQRSIRLLP